VSSLPVIHPLAKGILGSNNVWPQPKVSRPRKELKNTLILLSVCQTCKYSGVDFLGFLRSGETDISTFAASQHFRGGPTIKNELNGDGPLM
jgi:hypothetical protein